MFSRRLTAKLRRRISAVLAAGVMLPYLCLCCVPGSVAAAGLPSKGAHGTQAAQAGQAGKAANASIASDPRACCHGKEKQSPAQPSSAGDRTESCCNLERADVALRNDGPKTSTSASERPLAPFPAFANAVVGVQASAAPVRRAAIPPPVRSPLTLLQRLLI